MWDVASFPNTSDLPSTTLALPTLSDPPFWKCPSLWRTLYPTLRRDSATQLRESTLAVPPPSSYAYFGLPAWHELRFPTGRNPSLPVSTSMLLVPFGKPPRILRKRSTFSTWLTSTCRFRDSVGCPSLMPLASSSQSPHRHPFHRSSLPFTKHPPLYSSHQSRVSSCPNRTRIQRTTRLQRPTRLLPRTQFLRRPPLPGSGKQAASFPSAIAITRRSATPPLFSTSTSR